LHTHVVAICDLAVGVSVTPATVADHPLAGVEVALVTIAVAAASATWMGLITSGVLTDPSGSNESTSVA
jgi:hypothetical protein